MSKNRLYFDHIIMRKQANETRYNTVNYITNYSDAHKNSFRGEDAHINFLGGNIVKHRVLHRIVIW